MIYTNAPDTRLESHKFLFGFSFSCLFYDAVHVVCTDAVNVGKFAKNENCGKQIE